MALENAPEFQHAPGFDTGSNMTSWKYMRELLDPGKYSTGCEE